MNKLDLFISLMKSDIVNAREELAIAKLNQEYELAEEAKDEIEMFEFNLKIYQKAKALEIIFKELNSEPEIKRDKIDDFTAGKKAAYEEIIERILDYEKLSEE